jgi:hypothetical protein
LRRANKFLERAKVAVCDAHTAAGSAKPTVWRERTAMDEDFKPSIRLREGGVAALGMENQGSMRTEKVAPVVSARARRHERSDAVSAKGRVAKRQGGCARRIAVILGKLVAGAGADRERSSKAFSGLVEDHEGASVIAVCGKFDA